MARTNSSTAIRLAGTIAIIAIYASGCDAEVTCNAALRNSTIEIFLADDWEDPDRLNLDAECLNTQACIKSNQGATSVSFVVSSRESVDQLRVHVSDVGAGGTIVLDKIYDVPWKTNPGADECELEWSEARLPISSRDAA